MTEARRCPRCGAGLPADAPEGLCPACLLEQGLPPPGEPPGVAEGPSTAAYGGTFAAPAPAELAARGQAEGAGQFHQVTDRGVAGAVALERLDHLLRHALVGHLVGGEHV